MTYLLRRKKDEQFARRKYFYRSIINNKLIKMQSTSWCHSKFRFLTNFAMNLTLPMLQMRNNRLSLWEKNHIRQTNPRIDYAIQLCCVQLDRSEEKRKESNGWHSGETSKVIELFGLTFSNSIDIFFSSSLNRNLHSFR